jgi:hypothetical protein
MIKVQRNVKLSRKGRKDIPPDEGWSIKYRDNFPITKLKIGYSFNTGIEYEYGKTITIKNACKNIAKNNNKRMQFAVREWRGKIRVWRTK